MTVASDKNKKQKYRLVGPDETEISKRYISIDSPLSRALIGKQVGQQVLINAPKDDSPIKGETKTLEDPPLKYEILAVDYSGPAPNSSEPSI